VATLVFAGTTSHVSGIIRTPDAHPSHSATLDRAWQAMTEALAAADPDVVLVVAPDHYETFGPENLPIFCLGAAESHEPWNELGIPGETVRGDEQVGLALHAGLVRAGFDVSLSREMKLDHGYLVPVQRLGLGERRIVPLYVNCTTAPLPSLDRCRALGAALRTAIDDLPSDLRVAVLGTGGVSHWVGLPRMGDINQEWDRAFLDDFTTGQLARILAMSDEDIEAEAGNGAQEIRTWLVASACAGDRGGELLAYAPMDAWVTGIGVVELEVAP
jgi:aromatic ring-opening dioxygenase catalytic subunit (LigB family)